MKELLHGGQPTLGRLLNLVFRHRLPLELETGLFIVVSLLDLVMTWVLLSHDAGDERTWFAESNPVARYFLYSWGLRGLVYFKFAMIAFVTVICQIIAHHRLAVARRLLQFASLVVAGVVVYSVTLMVQHT